MVARTQCLLPGTWYILIEILKTAIGAGHCRARARNVRVMDAWPSRVVRLWISSKFTVRRSVQLILSLPFGTLMYVSILRQATAFLVVASPTILGPRLLKKQQSQTILATCGADLHGP